MKTRAVTHIIESVPTSDGAGVKLRRSLGSQSGLHVDPFLMLDEFYSDNPDDYLAGFPAHPHRGFETVTYMLDGHMRMRGFQLWLNLPSQEKMRPAAYRDIPARDIPTVKLAGGEVRVIAGTLEAGGASMHGPINGPTAHLTTDPMYLDVRMPPAAEVKVPVAPGHNAFLYVYDGDARVGAAGESRALPNRAAGVLSDGDEVRVQAGTDGARFLLLAAKPLHEPVVQYGPFVMNTREEIEQAIADYRSGRLATAA